MTFGEKYEKEKRKRGHVKETGEKGEKNKMLSKRVPVH
jgi:hypothetical protein